MHLVTKYCHEHLMEEHQEPEASDGTNWRSLEISWNFHTKPRTVSGMGFGGKEVMYHFYVYRGIMHYKLVLVKYKNPYLQTPCQ